jgi:hypothetical protein
LAESHLRLELKPEGLLATQEKTNSTRDDSADQRHARRITDPAHNEASYCSGGRIHEDNQVGMVVHPLGKGTNDCGIVVNHDGVCEEEE